jgi:hypothetical protein
MPSPVAQKTGHDRWVGRSRVLVVTVLLVVLLVLILWDRGCIFTIWLVATFLIAALVVRHRRFNHVPLTPPAHYAHDMLACLQMAQHRIGVAGQGGARLALVARVRDLAVVDDDGVAAGALVVVPADALAKLGACV